MYLFGWKVAYLFEDPKQEIDIIDALATSLIGTHFLLMILLTRFNLFFVCSLK